MKIRDLILAVLILGMVISTGTLVAFSSNGISDIKNTTSEASSGELLATPSKNLEYVAIGFRDSLDAQMQNQYKMVKSWALEPSLLEVAKNAQSYSKEELYEMWSAETTREYVSALGTGDGNPDNDLSPSASQYLVDLAASTGYPEIFITDYRGYTVSASDATFKFDSGPDDWRVFLQSGIPTFTKYNMNNPDRGGEVWYTAANDAADGFYVGSIVWNDNSSTWGIDIVSQLKDPETDEYLGQIKAVLDYGTFIDRFVNVENLDVYEIKVVDHYGIVVATSLEDKAKVNNVSFSLKDDTSFKNAIAEGSGSIANSYADENGQDVFAGYAQSNDVNGLVTMVSKRAADITAPIDAFIGTLQASIGDQSSSLQRNMIIIA